MPGKFSILLIDDDSELSSILERASKHVFPEANFFQVFSCREAKAHFEGLDTFGPNLILLDMDLQNSYGLDFLIYIKEGPLKAKNIPVIMLTVSELPDDILRSYQLGATAFTTKPFTYSDWKIYLEVLRGYWYGTVTTNQIRFYPQVVTPAA